MKTSKETVSYNGVTFPRREDCLSRTEARLLLRKIEGGPSPIHKECPCQKLAPHRGRGRFNEDVSRSSMARSVNQKMAPGGQKLAPKGKWGVDDFRRRENARKTVKRNVYLEKKRERATATRNEATYS